MKLREAPFQAIKEGRKDIELRLYDEKRKAITLGDYILFENVETKDSFFVLVKGLHRAASFDALFAAFPPERLGYAEGEKADPMDMSAYYSLDEIRENGVLGIELALQKEPREEIDIYSKGDYPANALSNFYPNAFTLDGVPCASMEGFLQSLKYKSIERQREICALSGGDAKRAGEGRWLYKLSGSLYWQGRRVSRYSKAYHALVRRAYEAMLSESAPFRLALVCTKERPLRHSIGKRFRFTTILTEKEFIGHLNAMRSQISKES